MLRKICARLNEGVTNLWQLTCYCVRLDHGNEDLHLLQRSENMLIWREVSLNVTFLASPYSTFTLFVFCMRLFLLSSDKRWSSLQTKLICKLFYEFVCLTEPRRYQLLVLRLQAPREEAGYEPSIMSGPSFCEDRSLFLAESIGLLKSVSGISVVITRI